MRAGVGYSEKPDSSSAGRQAADGAIRMAGRTDACDLALLFCTARHDQRILREAVAAVIGEAVPIYGGGTVGVITNDNYGYAGDQVGVACLWLDGASCEALSSHASPGGEELTGHHLGQKLSQAGISADTPVMLFYDAVGRNDETGVQLVMATWILEALQNELGFLPQLAGAGLMGDHVCSLTSHFTGREIADHRATAFAFGNGIQMDSVVVHGCRPASAYYTVTKADGPVILEIDNRPALTYMGEILGNRIAPEQYPFFLLFGVNSGQRWDAYDENNYASRLCFGIDRQRNGIVMFEPDMVPGTEFQVMLRFFDPDYIRSKFESLFDGLNGRKPVFAVYIDCAGRCAGYGGVDIEDARILQDVAAQRVPFLGLYTGVEIGSIAGRPRGLDWTGVFCLFSQSPTETQARPVPESVLWPVFPCESGTDTGKDAREILHEQVMTQALELDIQSIQLRYELELKRRGFQLLAELAVSLRETDDYMEMFIHVAKQINATLNMQKTVVLLLNENEEFVPVVLHGFVPHEQVRLQEQSIQIPSDQSELRPAVIISEETTPFYAELRSMYDLPYFIASPIILQGKTAALLLTGRIAEQPPYLTRLGNSDLANVSAITELLASVLVRLRLRDITVESEKDGLTGVWNRQTFQRLVEEHLNDGDNPCGAFMMIDIDHFKDINDTCGHIAGDNTLKACADIIREVLRDSDLVGRQGGDEFVVFCPGIQDEQIAHMRASKISAVWRRVMPQGSSSHVTASIGIAMTPHHGTRFDELYNNADIALYEAKRQGRNRCVLFSPGLAK